MLVSFKSLLGCAVLSAAIALAAGAVQAQQPPSGKMGPGGMGQGMMRQGMMAHCQQGQGMMGMGPTGMMYGAALDSRLDSIRAQLAVTDAQAAAWNAYAGAVKARVATMQGMRETRLQAMQSGSAIARMDAHIAAMEAMTESLKALKAPTEALYAVLTPEQKQKADVLLGTGGMMCTADAP